MLPAGKAEASFTKLASALPAGNIVNYALGRKAVL
jgi:hypothetical protein